MGRQVLRRHGAGAGARLLRLHHDRGHADGVRGLWRQRRGRAEARAAGAEARSGAARGADRGGDHASWASSPRCPRWPIRRSCWRGSARRSTTSPAAGSAGTSSPRARTPRRRTSAWTSCRRANSATTMADEYVDLVCKLFDSWDAGRGGDGPRDRHLRRLPQGPADPFRGQVLQVPRPAEHGALAAGQAGVRAGRRLAARPCVRREACRLDHRRPPTASTA